jgi:hypothetical protein
MFCPACGLGQPEDHRYCAACGRALPSHEHAVKGPKATRWFLGVPVAAGDRAGSGLRVSRYVDSIRVETPEGSVSLPSHHVRFSIWVEDRAAAAVSLTDDEATSVAEFLLASVVPAEPASPSIT